MAVHSRDIREYRLFNSYATNLTELTSVMSFRPSSLEACGNSVCFSTTTLSGFVCLQLQAFDRPLRACEKQNLFPPQRNEACLPPVTVFRRYLPAIRETRHFFSICLDLSVLSTATLLYDRSLSGHARKPTFKLSIIYLHSPSLVGQRLQSAGSSPRFRGGRSSSCQLSFRYSASLVVSASVVSGSLVCMAFIDIQPLSQVGLKNGERAQSESSDSLLSRLLAFILIGSNISVATGFERMYSGGYASAHGYLAISPFLRYRATPLMTY